MTLEEEIKNEAKLKCYDIASETDYLYSAAYNGIVMGAELATKLLIDKTCKWLKENLPNRMYDRNCCLDNFTEYLIEDFRKSMEE